MTDSLHILVVDDEPLARQRITSWLTKSHPDWTVSEAVDGIDALEKINSLKPQICLLDIEMPGLTGIELVRQWEELPCVVIFQTAYDQFAIEAFEASATDYLLKPFADDRLEAALVKAQKQLQLIPKSTLPQHFVEQKKYLERISVKAGDRIKVIDLDEVLYFLSEDHVTSLFTIETSFACDGSLSHLETQLDPEAFTRIHRNGIVALREIESFAKVTVRLKNGTELQVSRERGRRLKELLKL